MNGFFGDIRMDMIALESAIDLFEVENGLTADYLASDYSYDIENEGYATESATNAGDVDDAFAGLFGDMPAMEEATEGGDAPKEKFGAKLKKGIVNVINSIKSFFAKLGEGIANLWNKITKKKKEAENLQITPAEQTIIEQATDVRNAVKSALTILTNTLKADGGKLERIVNQINDALKQAKVKTTYLDYAKAKKHGNVTGSTNESSRTSLSFDNGIELKHEKTPAKSYDKSEDLSKSMAKMGKEYNSSKGSISVDIAEKAAEDIANGAAQMKEAMNIISEKYTALCERVHKMTKKADAPTKKVTETNEEFSQRVKESKPAAKHDGSDIENKYDYDRITDPVAEVKKVLMKYYYHQDGSFLTSAQKTCSTMTDICKKNNKLCGQLIGVADEINQDNEDAKTAFRLCKVYFKAANGFSTLSQYITMLTSGSIFAKHDGNKHAIDMSRTVGADVIQTASNKDISD